MPSERESMYSIIRDALVARGLRPDALEDIEAMLDVLGGDTFPVNKVERMLRRIRGVQPIDLDPVDNEDERVQALNAEERELVAFYRAKGQEIPPEIRAKLDAMRQRAREEKGTGNGE